MGAGDAARMAPPQPRPSPTRPVQRADARRYRPHPRRCRIHRQQAVLEGVMETILTRTGEMPALQAPQQQRRPLGRLLLTMALATADRLISPYGELPPEWFLFPLP